MKPLLAAPFLTLILAGCHQPPSASPSIGIAQSAPGTSQQVLHFVGPMDLTLHLQSNDNFESAVMTDNADRRFLLKSEPAASGVRLSDGKGVFIHFKNSDGVVELVPGKPISIREIKR